MKFVDFCAGIGGFRLGLEKLGFQSVYSCEIDENCEKTYALNFGNKFDAEDISFVNSFSSSQNPSRLRKHARY